MPRYELPPLSDTPEQTRQIMQRMIDALPETMRNGEVVEAILTIALVYADDPTDAARALMTALVHLAEVKVITEN